MEKLEKKKVLFLGGSNQMVETVKTAKELGIYSIVADSVSGAPAKKHAAAYHEIDPADINGLVNIYKMQNLDGIHAMLGDVTTWNALALCKRLDVPFFLPKTQLEDSAVEDKFKDFCRTFNVAFIDEATLLSVAAEQNRMVLEFPVIAKSYIAKQSIYATL
ncbi:hypothetical protein SAMN04487975_11559 [Planococcus glaciei]|uniref:hypothetical protein n=1 Tax=Planococcus glaciei TaxID=459472 RepID=UPI0008826E6C|nr:hypothetical protein [Planococcus glaciei]SDI35702.1 hypothetical protein SAMN04487975_11559 [Planococcus glaciei]